ncbi:hypothetical protein [Virgisporangium ochraceum]|uniref:Uncharacterized protein n=1 Tax=Virgisporangium ochraceum TaxID=65505 RepID=A0A8J4EFT5_9ACTN|nr:hypothetical protein [Virgisporangium ochraceum]GIJ74020.1 hypothetical protein Voc01_089370 [Virgisporangium ochraceum]
MPESRRFNTGGGAYADRGGVPQNANRRRYGGVVPSERRPPDGPVASGRRPAGGGEQVFAAARRHVDALDPAASDTGRLRASLARIEAEAARGEDAGVAVIVDELRTLFRLAPELGAAVAAGLLDPSVDVAAAVRTAAARAQ